MAEWSRLATATIRKYLPGYESEVFRNRAALALMKKKGRVETGVGGDGLQWQVEYRQTPMFANNHEQTLTFARQDYLKKAQLEWKGFAATDSISDREQEINKGPEALVKLVDQMAKRLLETMEQQFPDQIFATDATTTTNLTGLESLFAATQTITDGASTGRSANALDAYGYPNGTYATLSTVLGNYGGSGPTGGWPLGTVSDPAFDFWSPILVNYTSTKWGGAAPTFAQQCVQAFRAGITHAKRNKSKRGDLDLILADRDLYRQFKDKWDPTQRINVNRNDGMVSLGFGDVMTLDGVEITSDYSIPSGVAYGLNVDFMTLLSTKAGKIFELIGPDRDIESQSTRWATRFFGNLKCESPRHFVKFLALA